MPTFPRRVLYLKQFIGYGGVMTCNPAFVCRQIWRRSVLLAIKYDDFPQIIRPIVESDISVLSEMLDSLRLQARKLANSMSDQTTDFWRLALFPHGRESIGDLLCPRILQAGSIGVPVIQVCRAPKPLPSTFGITLLQAPSWTHASRKRRSQLHYILDGDGTSSPMYKLFTEELSLPKPPTDTTNLRL